METTNTESIVLTKTRELCQTLLSAPDLAPVRKQIDSFLENDAAKLQYQQVSEKMEFLNQKKNMGAEITDAEIDDFNSDREALLKNPVAKGFIEAQQEIQRMQDMLNQYVAKTFELGRVPTHNEVTHGGCGHGCGCEH